MKPLLEQLSAELRLAIEAEPSVHAAFVFGSTLKSDYPHDIDILLVYELREMESARRVREDIAALIERNCGGLPAHITMMTCSEIKNSSIISEVQHQSVL